MLGYEVSDFSCRVGGRRILGYDPVGVYVHGRVVDGLLVCEASAGRSVLSAHVWTRGESFAHFDIFGNLFNFAGSAYALVDDECSDSDGVGVYVFVFSVGTRRTFLVNRGRIDIGVYLVAIRSVSEFWFGLRERHPEVECESGVGSGAS